MARDLLLSLLLLVSAVPSPARADTVDPAMTASGMVPEVLSRSESPHAYDWRKATVEIEGAAGEVVEFNNFNTATFELGLGLPTEAGSLIRFGLRRSNVYPSPSSNDVGRTPFKQAAQQTRYEAFGGYALGLLEGRSMTRLSTWLPDVENATFFWIGGHYSHPNGPWLPQRNQPPAPLPGQDTVNSTFALELGLRWHVYLPQNFGLEFEVMDERPLGSTAALTHWLYLDGGILWSIGAH